MTHVILAMIQALLSMEKADEICSEDETGTVEPICMSQCRVHDDAGIMVIMIIMPRCACAREVYGSVFICVCRLLQLLKCK